MRDFAKLKILYTGWSLAYLQLCKFFFFFFFCGCAMGLMSAIGPEMKGVG